MESLSSKNEKFDSIYRAYKDKVYRTCCYYTKDEYIAEELMQETFILLYRCMESKEIRFINAYLMRTARNISLNFIRDSKHEYCDDELENVNDEKLTTASVEKIYLDDEKQRRQHELKECVLERLKEENEQWYEAVNMVCCLEMPQDVVAARLGISKETLYSRLHRARRWIQRNFGEEFDDVIGES